MRVCAGTESLRQSAGRVSSLCIPHVRLSVKRLHSKIPQRILLQQKWLQQHPYESSLHGSRQTEGKRSQGEGRWGGVLSSRLTRSRISATLCTTWFCNVILAWVDGTGCAVHTRCVCCDECHCWSYSSLFCAYQYRGTLSILSPGPQPAWGCRKQTLAMMCI